MADNKNKKSSAPRKRKELKKIDKGQVHIQSTFNNTLVTITDTNGNAVSWSSAGSLGYKGSRKGTPFAAQMAAETAAKAAKEHGLKRGSIRERSRSGQRIRDPRAFRVRFGDHLDLRRFSHPSQRLQTA